jgi:hypothetical protein
MHVKAPPRGSYWLHGQSTAGDWAQLGGRELACCIFGSRYANWDECGTEDKRRAVRACSLVSDRPPHRTVGCPAARGPDGLGSWRCKALPLLQ